MVWYAATSACVNYGLCDADVGWGFGSPDDLLVPQRLGSRIWKTMVINYDLGSLLKTWNEVL